MLVILVRKKQHLDQEIQHLNQTTIYQDKILSEVTHDLRTPLASINSLNYLISASGELNKKQKEYLDSSNLAVENGLDILNNFQQIRKIESAVEIEYDEINIPQLIHHSIEKTNPIFLDKEQTLFVDIPTDILLNTNREMMQTVFDTLLIYTNKFANSQSDISIHVNQFGTQLLFDIIYESNTIDQDSLPILFDKFLKFSNSKLAESLDMDFGLYLIKSYILLLGGTLNLVCLNDSKYNFKLTFNV